MIKIDWLNKVFSMLKNFGYLIAIVFVILFLVNNGLKKNRIEKLIKKTTELNTKNDILIKNNKLLDDQLGLKDSLLVFKEDQLDSISDVIKKSKIKESYWKSKYDNIAEDLSKIPDDSSYRFLISVFNYPGEYLYSFNGLQVKGLHRTYLESKNKDNQLLSLEEVLSGCEYKNVLFGEAKVLLEEKYSIEKTKVDNYKSIVINKDEEIKLLNKELSRNSKWFAGFGIGPQLGIGYDFIHQESVITFGIGIQYNVYKW